MRFLWLRVKVFLNRSFSFISYILRNNPNADSLNIPLVLYGSGWVDEQYGFMRFCGEREIDGNDKTGMILSNVPHYYVVGVELHKVAK